MTHLEAFKRIKWKLENEGTLGEEYELCDVVEKELMEKVFQDNYIKMLEDRINNLETSYLRDKKALEIIKESGCSLEHILLIEKTKNYDE